MKRSDATHTMVKKAYAAVAEKRKSCCCDKSCDVPDHPVPEAELGVSCGNPVAFSHLKEGDKSVLHGGINAVLWDKPDQIEAEMRRVVPVLKQNGGYIFSSDHSVPSSVSLEDFRRIINLAKTLGAY